MQTIISSITGGSAAFRASGAITKGMIVKLSAAGVVTKCGANEAAIGVAETAAADGAIVTVRLVGGCEVVASAAISAGAFIESTADGEAVTSATDKHNVIGWTTDAATAKGDIIPMIISRFTLSV